MEEEQKEGAPAWMVSFGDMMTLILTFFILLVSMSKTQQVGLVASGVGSFVVALRSFGLPGVLDDYERASVFENIRTRFNLPPEEDPERREEHIQASSLEVIRKAAAQALEPQDQIAQPAMATFARGSAQLDGAAEKYLDLLAPTLYPSAGQSLLLEGHAHEGHEGRQLAFERARAVRDYLVDEHDFPAHRIEIRAWLTEIATADVATRSVDARLLLPDEN